MRRTPTPDPAPSTAKALGTDGFFLRSERLGFRTWAPGDEGLAAAIWGDPEVTRLTGGPFEPWQVQARLADEMANLDRHGVQYWPLFRRETGEHVGCCGLRPRDLPARVFELGYQLRRAAWGQGYAQESARAVIGWSRSQGVRALVAGHHPENHASRRTLLRLGFVYVEDEYYPPTGLMEPCYRLELDPAATA